MGGERSALRQAAAGVAAAAGGVAREPRASEPGAVGAGGATGDEQRHDRPDVGPDPQAERRQRLAPPTTGLQRNAATGAGAHVQGLGRPQRTRLAGDRPGGALRRPDGGRFLWTLMATDIATGWSESLPIVMRDGAVVLTGLQLIRRQLPFPLRGIDADNDPVFMNQRMEAWSDRPGQEIVLTRSRAYQSNDQAWVGHPKQSRGFIPRDCLGTPVEQKNGMLVRRVVGYQRLVSLDAAQVLGELYVSGDD